MKRSKRLKPVVKIAKAKSNKAAKILQQTRHQQSLNIARLDQLMVYKQEYEDKILQQGMGGVKGSELQKFYHFVEKLELAIEQQKQQLNHTGEQLLRIIQYWQILHNHHKNLDEFVDRLHSNDRKELEKLEQKELDDFVCTLYARKIFK